MSNGLKRADYKNIKAMNRTQLSDYLSRIWRRGYEAGLKSTVGNIEPPPKKKASEENAER